MTRHRIAFLGISVHSLAILALLMVTPGCGPSAEQIAALEAERRNRHEQEEAKRQADARAVETQRLAQEEANRQEAERVRLAAHMERADLCLTANRMLHVLELARLHYAYFSEFPSGQQHLTSPSDGSAALLSQVVMDVWGGTIEIQMADGRLTIRSSGPDQKPGTSDDLVHRLRFQKEDCGEPDFALETDVRSLGLCPSASSGSPDDVKEVAKVVSETLRELGYSDFHEFFKAQDGVLCGRLLSMDGQVHLGLRTEDRRKHKAELERQMAEVQIQEWASACNRFTALQPSYCAELDSPYAQGVCQEVQRQALKQRTVFAIPVVRTVTYDASAKTYTVKIFGLLRLDGELELDDCISEQCMGQLISLRPLKVAGGEANYYVWLKRYRDAFGRLLADALTFKVKASDLKYPRIFDKSLHVDALVEAVGHQSSIVGDWFDYENVETRLLGLRAYTSDFSWTRMVRKPQVKASRLECPWPEYFRDEPKKHAAE